MTHLHMINNETICVEESLDEIDKAINYSNYKPQWIGVTESVNSNRIIVNVNNILYMYDDGIDLL